MGVAPPPNTTPPLAVLGFRYPHDCIYRYFDANGIPPGKIYIFPATVISMEEGKYRLYDLLDYVKEKQKAEVREKEKNESMKSIHLSAIEQTIGFLKSRINSTYILASECELERVLGDIMLLGENLYLTFKPFSMTKEEFEKYIQATSSFIKDIANILRESCWLA